MSTSYPCHMDENVDGPRRVALGIVAMLLATSAGIGVLYATADRRTCSELSHAVASNDMHPNDLPNRCWPGKAPERPTLP